MKKMFLYALAVFWLSLPQVNAQEKPIRLIVRSDDMGFSHAANLALLETVDEGITTSIEVMVPTPWFPEAVALLKDYPDLDIGIHITLTSEWSNVKWRPLTKAPSLSEENGYFYPMIWPNDNYGPEQALQAHDWKQEEIENEIRAQIEVAVRNIPQVSHLTAHMGCTSMAPEVEQVYRKLAAEFELDIFPEELGVARASYVGPTDTPAQKRSGFIEMLKQLKAGTYLFVDHPAYDVDEVRAIHHIGYGDVATDRQGVTNLLTDPEIIQLVEDLNIVLISYEDLKKISQ